MRRMRRATDLARPETIAQDHCDDHVVVRIPVGSECNGAAAGTVLRRDQHLGVAMIPIQQLAIGYEQKFYGPWTWCRLW
jgi:hypothetical protein